MASQTIPGGGLWLPAFMAYNVPSTTTLALTAAGEQVAPAIFKAPKTGNIAKLGFRVDTVTTATDTDVRLETVDLATGNPTGTLVNAGANVTVLAASLTAATWVWATLGTVGAVTQNVDYAAVIAPTGTPNYTVTSEITNVDGVPTRFPFADRLSAAVWSKAKGYVLGVEYAGGEKQYIDGLFPFSAFTTVTLNAVGTDRAGMRFQLPVPMKFAGFNSISDMDQDCTFILYGSNGSTVLWTSPTFDKDLRFGTTTGTFRYRLPNANQIALLANTTYRFVQVVSASTVTTQAFTVDAAETFNLHAGGANFHYTVASGAPANEASWTNTTTQRPFMQLLFNGFDDGVSTGGGSQGVYG